MGVRIGRQEQHAQPKPEGIAQAFILGEDFIDGDPVALILGDNIFYGNMQIKRIVDEFAGGGLVFGYYVQDPERYGVVEFDADGNALGIEEKPAKPKSHYAVPGLYLYDGRVAVMSRALTPSARGELEITDLNMAYLEQGKLRVEVLGRGIAWLDTGTPMSLLEASEFIATIQNRQGLRVACLEEIAMYRGFITREQLEQLVNNMPKCDYRAYLEDRFFSDSPYLDPDRKSVV